MFDSYFHCDELLKKFMSNVSVAWLIDQFKKKEKIDILTGGKQMERVASDELVNRLILIGNSKECVNKR